MTEAILLRDSEIMPTTEILEAALEKNVFEIYEALIDSISSKEFELKHEWNYYKDGKAWLCKVTFKKKTIFWLSAWDKCLKISFYFNEKTRNGVFSLAINDEIIRSFEATKTIGKLLPLTIDIYNKNQLADLKEIIRYKKSLK